MKAVLVLISALILACVCVSACFVPGRVTDSDSVAHADSRWIPVVSFCVEGIVVVLFTALVAVRFFVALNLEPFRAVQRLPDR